MWSAVSNEAFHVVTNISKKRVCTRLQSTTSISDKHPSSSGMLGSSDGAVIIPDYTSRVKFGAPQVECFVPFPYRGRRGNSPRRTRATSDSLSKDFFDIGEEAEKRTAGEAGDGIDYFSKTRWKHIRVFFG